MKQINTILTIPFILFLLGYSQLVLADKDLVLGIGFSKTFKAPITSKVYVSNGKVLKIKNHENELIVIGKSKGLSDLIIGSKTFRVQVLPKRNFLLFRELNESIDNTMGLKIEIKNYCLRITGKLLRWEDWRKIHKVGAQIKTVPNCPIPFSFAPKIEAILRPKVYQELKKELQVFKSKIEIKISSAGKVEINLNDKKVDKAIIKALKPWGLYPLSKQKLSGNLKYQIELFAIGSSELESNGIQLPSEIQYKGDVGVQQDLLIAKLTSLFNSASYKKLIQADIYSDFDSEAQFHSGGEVPFKVVSETSSNIVWKKYGFLLSLKPKESYSRKLNLKVSMELSNISGASQSDIPPKIQKHKLSNSYKLEINQRNVLLNFKLSGNQDGNHSLGFLHGIPIFGDLFSHKDEAYQSYHIFLSVTPIKSE